MTSTTTNKQNCPTCGCPRVSGCRCSSNVEHDMNSLKQGHGSVCKNGHRWSYSTKSGKAVVMSEKKEEKEKVKIKLLKTKEYPMPKPETVKLLVDFIKFASDYIKLDGEEIKVRLVHAAPKEPITTGCYAPATKLISVIAQNRHFIDYCRTIAHEMTHLKQHLDGRVEAQNQEIGGEIEDEANSVSGQVVKSYIKKHLTPEQKKYLGLGTY